MDVGENPEGAGENPEGAGENPEDGGPPVGGAGAAPEAPGLGPIDDDAEPEPAGAEPEDERLSMEVALGMAREYEEIKTKLTAAVEDGGDPPEIEALKAQLLAFQGDEGAQMAAELLVNSDLTSTAMSASVKTYHSEERAVSSLQIFQQDMMDLNEKYEERAGATALTLGEYRQGQAAEPEPEPEQ